MRIKIHETSIYLSISPDETRDWATCWPCSVLSGRRVRASFDTGGLCDLEVSGAECDPPGDEFNALTSDFLKNRVPTDHPCYFVTVGQFTS